MQLDWRIASAYLTNATLQGWIYLSYSYSHFQMNRPDMSTIGVRRGLGNVSKPMKTAQKLQDEVRQLENGQRNHVLPPERQRNCHNANEYFLFSYYFLTLCCYYYRYRADLILQPVTSKLCYFLVQNPIVTTNAPTLTLTRTYENGPFPKSVTETPLLYKRTANSQHILRFPESFAKTLGQSKYMPFICNSGTARCYSITCTYVYQKLLSFNWIILVTICCERKMCALNQERVPKKYLMISCLTRLFQCLKNIKNIFCICASQKIKRDDTQVTPYLDMERKMSATKHSLRLVVVIFARKNTYTIPKLAGKYLGDQFDQTTTTRDSTYCWWTFLKVTKNGRIALLTTCIWLVNMYSHWNYSHRCRTINLRKQLYFYAKTTFRYLNQSILNYTLQLCLGANTTSTIYYNPLKLKTQKLRVLVMTIQFEIFLAYKSSIAIQKICLGVNTTSTISYSFLKTRAQNLRVLDVITKLEIFMVYKSFITLTTQESYQGINAMSTTYHNLYLKL
jgi:hypothetical protein